MRLARLVLILLLSLLNVCAAESVSLLRKEHSPQCHQHPLTSTTEIVSGVGRNAQRTEKEEVKDGDRAFKRNFATQDEADLTQGQTDAPDVAWSAVAANSDNPKKNKLLPVDCEKDFQGAQEAVFKKVKEAEKLFTTLSEANKAVEKYQQNAKEFFDKTRKIRSTIILDQATLEKYTEDAESEYSNIMSRVRYAKNDVLKPASEAITEIRKNRDFATKKYDLHSQTQKTSLCKSLQELYEAAGKIDDAHLVYTKSFKKDLEIQFVKLKNTYKRAKQLGKGTSTRTLTPISTTPKTPVETGSLAAPNSETSLLRKEEDVFPFVFDLHPIRIIPTFLSVFDYIKVSVEAEKQHVDACQHDNRDQKLCQHWKKMISTDKYLSAEKVNVLIAKIVPSIFDTYEKRPLRYRPPGPLREPEIKEDGMCAELKTNWQSDRMGLERGDVMMYVSAWPVNSFSSNAPVWAVPCATIDGRVVAVAVNFNPSRIMDTENTTRDGKKVISKALQTSQCPSDYAVVMSGTSKRKNMPCSVCASVRLNSGRSRLQVKYSGTEKWVECSATGDPSALNESIFTTCPEFTERCEDSTFTVDLELHKNPFSITGQHYGGSSKEQRKVKRGAGSIAGNTKMNAFLMQSNKKTDAGASTKTHQSSHLPQIESPESKAKRHADRMEFESRIPGVIPEPMLMERAKGSAEGEDVDDPNAVVGANYHDTMTRIERKKFSKFKSRSALRPNQDENDGATVLSISFSAALLVFAFVMAV